MLEPEEVEDELLEDWEVELEDDWEVELDDGEVELDEELVLEDDSSNRVMPPAVAAVVLRAVVAVRFDFALFLEVRLAMRSSPHL